MNAQDEYMKLGEKHTENGPLLKNVYIPIPSYVTSMLNYLEEAGYEAWIVGGYVRDYLLERESADIDITTNATWRNVQKIAEANGAQTYETGIKHGTLTVIFPDCNPLEITTFRKDGLYSDSRHPDEVQFVSSIYEDLARRDFTINALAYNPKQGVLDPYDGYTDLHARQIRAVGEAQRRFKEDALRILRCIRFASTLGFEIETNTYEAMLSSKSYLSNISIERITSELNQTLMGEYIHDALMNNVDILAYLLPELVACKGFAQKTKYHIYDVLEHTAYAVQYAKRDLMVKWAALCHDLGKPGCAFALSDGQDHFYGHCEVSAKITRGLLKRFQFSDKFVGDVEQLVRFHDFKNLKPTKKGIKKMLQELNGREDLFIKLCELKEADAKAHAPIAADRFDKKLTFELFEEILNENEAFKISDLAINGADLIEIGFETGPQIGTMLKHLLNLVISEEIENDRTALLEAAKLHKDSQS